MPAPRGPENVQQGPVLAAAYAGIGVLLACALLLSIGGTAARAHDHEPPKVFLLHEEERLQRAVLYGECWASEPAYCLDYVPDPRYPKPVKVRAGTSLTIRLMKPQKPRSLDLEVNRQELEGYERLAPVVVAGETVAWELPLTPERPGRLYRVRLHADWMDEETGGRAPHQAYWALQVETRRSGPR